MSVYSFADGCRNGQRSRGCGGLRRRLLEWYARHKRDLPWRRTRDPYRIWISEVMLQQTRVAAVIPYYERFLERFPDVAALAKAPEQGLLAAWSGLGYYSRARNLQKAARTIVELGQFPCDYDSLRALAGVGDYTASAIASIAFDLPHPVLDGNVLRVLSRLTAEQRQHPVPGSAQAAARDGRPAIGRQAFRRVQPGVNGTGRDGVPAQAAAVRQVPIARALPGAPAGL